MIEKDFSQYKLNLVRSPYDSRDFKFGDVCRRLEIELPTKTNNRALMLPVRDQGSQGTCAAQSGEAFKEFQEVKDIGLAEQLSAQFVYNLREDKNSEGMTNRDLMKILQTIGICYEKNYPYGSLDIPSASLIKEANLFRINNYARIYDLDELRLAIYIKGPGVIAVPVYNFNDRIWYQNPGDSFLGGHDMCYVDYNDDEKVIWIKNSWGTEFGFEGYTKMPYADFGLAWEWWSSVDLDTTLPDGSEKPGCWGRFWSTFKK